MRFWILLSLIIFTAYFTIQLMMYPQLRLNPLLDRLTHPFDQRIRYRIAEVDPRFKLSPEQVQSISQQAAQIWKEGTGQDYFVYDPNAQLEIHLIYDQRQSDSEQSREHLSQLESNQQTWVDKKKRLDQVEQDLLWSKQLLDQKKQQLDQQIQQFNQEQQFAQQNPDQFRQRKETLQQNVQILQQEISQYNQKIAQLNGQIGELNALDQQLDASVQQYKQRFQPHMFHKGLFNGKQILIYEFESEADLRLTLAHELGHALGLAHNDDPKALMYPIMKDQDLLHFQLTPTDRELLLNR